MYYPDKLLCLIDYLMGGGILWLNMKNFNMFSLLIQLLIDGKGKLSEIHFTNT